MGLLEGRTAIVTGAGRGLGRAHAIMLARHGANVVVNDLGSSAAGDGVDATPAEEVVAEIEKLGGKAVINTADVSDWKAAQDMVQQAVDTFGSLEILVNNAGIIRDRMMINMSEDEWDSVTKVHLKGTFAPLHHAANYWRIRSKGGETFDASRDSYYAFGELSIPVIAPAQGSALGSSLDLSMAGRYEHYSQLGSVTTPKFGVIYAPLEGVRLKGSWGRSFRAATFYEQYSPTLGFLYDASTFGASGGTVIYYVGGNADLRPERSTNWSATLALSPSSLPHAELEISYFDIRYRDRIVTPLAYPTQALLNPAYAPFVTLAPDGATQADIIDRLVTFTNLTSAAYDPSQVRAIVANANINAGRQKIRGIDVLARYSFDLAAGRLSMALNGSYLESEQQLIEGQAAIALAGTLFNPPHLRGRADVSWTDLGGVTLTAGLSYIGSVRDSRSQPGVRVASMLPLDLTARYRSREEDGWLGGIDIIASVQNLFNDKPDTIATTSYFHAPYDSTNYSPFGRVVSLTVSKSW